MGIPFGILESIGQQEEQEQVPPPVAPSQGVLALNRAPQRTAPALPEPSRGGGGVLAGLFGGASGQNLTDEQRKALGKSALQSASASLLASSGANAQGFTPGFLQSIGQALGAGKESFAGGVAGVQAQETARSLSAAAEKGPKAQIAALRKAQNQALSFGDTDTVDSIEDIVQGLSP